MKLTTGGFTGVAFCGVLGLGGGECDGDVEEKDERRVDISSELSKASWRFSIACLIESIKASTPNRDLAGSPFGASRGSSSSFSKETLCVPECMCGVCWDEDRTYVGDEGVSLDDVNACLRKIGLEIVSVSASKDTKKFLWGAWDLEYNRTESISCAN